MQKKICNNMTISYSILLFLFTWDVMWKNCIILFRSRCVIMNTFSSWMEKDMETLFRIVIYILIFVLIDCSRHHEFSYGGDQYGLLWPFRLPYIVIIMHWSWNYQTLLRNCAFETLPATEKVFWEWEQFANKP